jgi:hypothetical protein
MMPQINKSVNPEIGKLRNYFLPLLLGNMSATGGFRWHFYQTEFSTAELTTAVESERQLTKFYIAELEVGTHTLERHQIFYS